MTPDESVLAIYELFNDKPNGLSNDKHEIVILAPVHLANNIFREKYNIEPQQHGINIIAFNRAGFFINISMDDYARAPGKLILDVNGVVYNPDIIENPNIVINNYN